MVVHVRACVIVVHRRDWCRAPREMHTRTIAADEAGRRTGRRWWAVIAEYGSPIRGGQRHPAPPDVLRERHADQEPTRTCRSQVVLGHTRPRGDVGDVHSGERSVNSFNSTSCTSGEFEFTAMIWSPSCRAPACRNRGALSPNNTARCDRVCRRGWRGRGASRLHDVVTAEKKPGMATATATPGPPGSLPAPASTVRGLPSRRAARTRTPAARRPLRERDRNRRQRCGRQRCEQNRPDHPPRLGVREAEARRPAIGAIRPRHHGRDGERDDAQPAGPDDVEVRVVRPGRIRCAEHQQCGDTEDGAADHPSREDKSGEGVGGTDGEPERQPGEGEGRHVPFGEIWPTTWSASVIGPGLLGRSPPQPHRQASRRADDEHTDQEARQVRTSGEPGERAAGRARPPSAGTAYSGRLST